MTITVYGDVITSGEEAVGFQDDFSGALDLDVHVPDVGTGYVAERSSWLTDDPGYCAAGEATTEAVVTQVLAAVAAANVLGVGAGGLLTAVSVNGFMDDAGMGTSSVYIAAMYLETYSGLPPGGTVTAYCTVGGVTVWSEAFPFSAPALGITKQIKIVGHAHTAIVVGWTTTVGFNGFSAVEFGAIPTASGTWAPANDDALISPGGANYSIVVSGSTYKYATYTFGGPVWGTSANWSPSTTGSYVGSPRVSGVGPYTCEFSFRFTNVMNADFKIGIVDISDATFLAGDGQFGAAGAPGLWVYLHFTTILGVTTGTLVSKNGISVLNSQAVAAFVGLLQNTTYAVKIVVTNSSFKLYLSGVLRYTYAGSALTFVNPRLQMMMTNNITTQLGIKISALSTRYFLAPGWGTATVTPV